VHLIDTSRHHWDPGLLLSDFQFVSTIRSICAGRQNWINYISSHLFDSGSNFMTNQQTTPFKTGPTNLCVASLNWLIAYFQEVPSTWSETQCSQRSGAFSACIWEQSGFVSKLLLQVRHQPTVRPCGAYDMFSCFSSGKPNLLLCKITRALV